MEYLREGLGVSLSSIGPSSDFYGFLIREILQGHEVVSLAIFDMFPYTSHVETWKHESCNIFKNFKGIQKLFGSCFKKIPNFAAQECAVRVRRIEEAIQPQVDPVVWRKWAKLLFVVVLSTLGWPVTLLF